MDPLDLILTLCPASDAGQKALLRKAFRIRRLEDLQGTVVFGAGRLGASTVSRLKALGIRVSGISDNAASWWISLSKKGRLDRYTTVVIASKFAKEICLDLRRRGARRIVPHFVLSVLFPDEFPSVYHQLCAGEISRAKEKIRQAFDLMADKHSRDLFLSLLWFRIVLDPADLPDPTPGQYFPGGFWTLSDREVFVDVGACGGDTLKEFLSVTGGKFSKYFAVEPAPANLAELRRAFPEGKDERIVVLPFGAGDRRQRVAFDGDAGGESRVAAGGSASIEVVPLDEVLASEAVTTVKIDVEGYEPEVLRGAEGIIRRRVPKLAISVYHRLSDLWELPLWVNERGLGYRFYLRHHTEEIYDTVLYCVPPSGEGRG